MKTLLLLTLPLLLVACGSRVDPELASSVSKFTTYFNVSNPGVDVVFGAIPYKDIVGLCEGHTVTIDRTWFDAATQTQRDLLVMHELGHCILGHEHDERFQPDGCPESFMYSGLPSDSCFATHGNSLLDTYVGTAPGNSDIPN